MQNPEKSPSLASAWRDPITAVGACAVSDGTLLLGVALRHALDEALAQVDRLVLCHRGGPESVSLDRLHLLQTRLWQLQDLAATVAASLEAEAGGAE